MSGTPAPADPLVTVLMSVRNGERHLRAAIESVLAQTFADFEFIVVDDASTDASREIVAEFDDARIRPIRNDARLGLTRSLNRGLEGARGRYVARMDADDVSARDRFERQVAFFERHPDCAVVATYARKIDDDSAAIGAAHTPTDPKAIARQLQVANCITQGSVMMRTDALRGVGGYDEGMERAQDYDLWLRLSEEHAIGTVPEYLYFWRDHGSGISRTHAAEQEACAARAKGAAHARQLGKLLAGVAGGSVGVAAAVDAFADRLRREDAHRSGAAHSLRLVDRLDRRVPRLGALRFRLRRRRRIAEAEAVVRSVRAGERVPAEAASALAALILGGT